MKDLTQGSIPGHLVAMAVPMAIGMLVQTLYFMVDLYFVSRLGGAALAGVGAAGNFNFAILALTQMIAVGTVALISHAVGAKDQEKANLVFNQSLLMGALCGLATLLGGYAFLDTYMSSLGADAATVAAGETYLRWFIPGLALQFAMVAMGSALRGTGIVKPTMVVQLATVLVNIVLAPVLIAGVGTGHPLGVAGAGLASTLAVVAGTVLLAFYYGKLEHYVRFHPDQWRPRLAIWRQVLNIGLPAGGEFLLMFAYMAVIYFVIRQFGSAAQAGFGVGSRVMQSIFLPAMAIGFAVAPVAGQNFGAKNAARVRETFRAGATMGAVAMACLTALCQWRGDRFIAAFTNDPETLAVGTAFLATISWNFVCSGFVFACSGMFQALGNTWPAVISSATRLVTFVVPVLWLSHQPGFRIDQVWMASVATVTLQAAVSWWLVRREFSRRLQFAT
jgi:putative MATE family efflux protein